MMIESSCMKKNVFISNLDNSMFNESFLLKHYSEFSEIYVVKGTG